MNNPLPDHLKKYNIYTLLNVTPTSSLFAIKKAYRKKALQLHPDKNKTATSQSDFQVLQDAYEFIQNPTSRANYDLFLEKQNALIQHNKALSQKKRQFKQRLEEKEEAYSTSGQTFPSSSLNSQAALIKEIQKQNELLLETIMKKQAPTATAAASATAAALSNDAASRMLMLVPTTSPIPPKETVLTYFKSFEECGVVEYPTGVASVDAEYEQSLKQQSTQPILISCKSREQAIRIVLHFKKQKKRIVPFTCKLLRRSPISESPIDSHTPMTTHTTSEAQPQHTLSTDCDSTKTISSETVTTNTLQEPSLTHSKESLLNFMSVEDYEAKTLYRLKQLAEEQRNKRAQNL